MRKIEIISLVTFFICFITNLIWPKNSLLVLISIHVIFGLYTLLSWFLLKDKNTKVGNVYISLLTGYMIAIILYGILFKIMIWQGGNNLLTLGLSLISALYFSLFLYLKKDQKNDEFQEYYFGIKLRSIIFLMMGLVFLSIPSSGLIKIYNRDEPKYADLRIRAFENPTNEEYQKEADEEYKKIMMKKFEEFGKTQLNHK